MVHLIGGDGGGVGQKTITASIDAPDLQNRYEHFAAINRHIYPIDGGKGPGRGESAPSNF